MITKILVIIPSTNSSSLSQIRQSDLISQTYRDIPKEDEWRVHLLREFIEARHDRDLLHEFSYNELDDLIHLACTN